jgi:deoxycytidine triphosphate deaminase
MPRILTENELKEAVRQQTFIKNGLPENVEGVKYDFRMSSSVLKAEFGGPVDTKKLTEQAGKTLHVDPGEVVFVLTEESLDLRQNILANLSPKRKLSHDGILVLGGFCIDPLYQGKLLVGLYNFSSSPFPLIPGKKLIAAVFYELQKEELSEFKRPAVAIKDFPEELIRLMQQYKPVSNLGLAEQVKKISADLDNLRRDFHNREDWFKRFQQGLEDQGKRITGLIDGLEKETKERQETEKEFRDDLKSIYWRTAKLAAGVGAIGAVVIALLLYFMQKCLPPQ